MLILSRKPGESIMIGDNIEIRIVEVNGKQVKFAIDAPRDISVYRQEVYTKIRDENRQALQVDQSELKQLAKKTINRQNGRDHHEQ